MTVYVLSWENSDMETMVFSSFEKANSVAKFILNHLPSGKIAWEEQDEDSIVYHLDYQNDEDVNDYIKVEVKDTTGAGDAFFAGVATGLTYGKTLKEIKNKI